MDFHSAVYLSYIFSEYFQWNYFLLKIFTEDISSTSVKIQFSMKIFTENRISQRKQALIAPKAL